MRTPQQDVALHRRMRKLLSPKIGPKFRITDAGKVEGQWILVIVQPTRELVARVSKGEVQELRAA